MSLAGVIMNDKELSSTLNTMSGKIDDMHKVIYGNGEPQESLVVRFALVEAFTNDAKKLMWISVGAAIAATIGLVVTLITT